VAAAGGLNGTLALRRSMGVASAGIDAHATGGRAEACAMLAPGPAVARGLELFDGSLCAAIEVETLENGDATEPGDASVHSGASLACWAGNTNAAAVAANGLSTGTPASTTKDCWIPLPGSGAVRIAAGTASATAPNGVRCGFDAWPPSMAVVQWLDNLDPEPWLS